MKTVWLCENEQARWFEFEEPYDMPNDVTVTKLVPESKPFSFPQEAAAFKAWFDAWYVGDGEQGETIPTQSDPHFLTYIDQYTLGFGAWMAAKHAAKAGA